MRSRFLMELTTPEIEGYLSQGGKTAMLPVGCVEMHGPHQPVGTDSLIAKGFSLRLAEASDGLVLPEIHYTWAGSTDGFVGTISIEPDMVQKTVEAVAVKVFRMGFKRMVAVSVHHGNHYPLFLFARRFYEDHLIPALYINPYEPFSEEVGAIFAGEYSRSKEASLVLASLHILGKPDLYSEEEMKYDDTPPPHLESRGKIKHGVVGYYMQDPRHHACPSEYVSLQKGLEFINKQVELILPTVESLDEYAEESKDMKNKGWWM